MSDLCSTRAHQPDVPVVPATIQFPTPLVFAYKGHQSVEDSWHWGGEDYHGANAPGYYSLDSI